MNFYKHYMGDYARKTARLSILEHGAYRLLLDEYYSTLAPLPESHDELCRITRAITEPETQAVTKVVSMFFVLKSDGYHNKRCDDEIKVWKKQAEFNREVGKLGGRPRKTEPVTEQEPKEKPTPEVRSQKLEVRTQNPETKKTTTAHGGKKNGFVLPDWIPVEPWNAWIETRQRIRKPPTDTAKRIAVTKLKYLNRDGFPPAQVLMQSTFNGWAGLFPIKEQK